MDKEFRRCLSDFHQTTMDVSMGTFVMMPQDAKLVLLGYFLATEKASGVGKDSNKKSNNKRFKANAKDVDRAVIDRVEADVKRLQRNGGVIRLGNIHLDPLWFSGKKPTPEEMKDLHAKFDSVEDDLGVYGNFIEYLRGSLYIHYTVDEVVKLLGG